MLEIKECIEFWKKYLDLKEQRLNDFQYKVVLSTIKHLGDYEKLKAQVILPLYLRVKPN